MLAATGDLAPLQQIDRLPCGESWTVQPANFFIGQRSRWRGKMVARSYDHLIVNEFLGFQVPSFI